MNPLTHRFKRRRFLTLGSGVVAANIVATNQLPQPSLADESLGFSIESIRYHTIKIEDLDIFYREAGSPDNPTILLLHGFPTSSHMFRNLMLALSDRYHLVAPDYPGYGNSSMPTVNEFDYTFDNLAAVMDKFVQTLELSNYSLYLMDYGAPIGFRLATQHPEKVQTLLIQNGNAYEEGLKEFWDPIRNYWAVRSEENANPLRSFLNIDGTKWQYLTGVRDASAISPDNWNMDQRFLDRPGNQEIQLALFYSYSSNLPLYPEWQAYMREYQPPALITWGKNDPIFPESGAHPYKQDLQTLDFHLLETGHFALEEDGDTIARLIRDFLGRHLAS